MEGKIVTGKGFFCLYKWIIYRSGLAIGQIGQMTDLPYGQSSQKAI